MVRVGGASTSPRRTLIPPPQFQKFHLARPGGAHCFPFGADFLRETAEAASLCAGPCSGLWWSEKQRNQITGRLHGSRSPPEESVFQVFPCLRWRACAPEIPALQRPTLHPPASETWVWGKHARSADSTLSRTRFRWLYFSLILCCVTLFLFPSVDQFIWNQEKKLKFIVQPANQQHKWTSCHVIWQHSEDFGGKRKPSLSQETKHCRKRFSQHTAVFTHNHLILKMPPVTFICNRNINCNVPAFLNWPYFLNRFLVLQINYIWPKIPS